MQPAAGLGNVLRQARRTAAGQVGQWRGAAVKKHLGPERLLQCPPLQGQADQRLAHRLDPAYPRRLGVGLVLAAPRKIHAHGQKTRHVPAHEQTQRRARQRAMALQPLARRLPLQPCEIHAAGIAAMTLGDVRALMRQDRRTGPRRQRVEQGQAQPHHVARPAKQYVVLADTGVEVVVQVHRIQRRRAECQAQPLDFLEQLRRVHCLQGDAVLAGIGTRRKGQLEHAVAEHARWQGHEPGQQPRSTGQPHAHRQRQRAQGQPAHQQKAVAQQQPGTKSQPLQCGHGRYCAGLGGRSSAPTLPRPRNAPNTLVTLLSRLWELSTSYWTSWMPSLSGNWVTACCAHSMAAKRLC